MIPIARPLIYRLHLQVTLCDFEVRRLGNLHRWTVQCVLMINMFNEKIYLVLWWWFFLVAVLTCLNFVYWLVISIVPYFGYDFVRKYLECGSSDISKYTSKYKIEFFVNRVLRKDGVVLLRLIAKNAGDIVASEIVNRMWQIYGVYTPAPEKTGLTEELVSLVPEPDTDWRLETTLYRRRRVRVLRELVRIQKI